MSTTSRGPGPSGGSAPPDSLVERVRARVLAADEALRRREAGAARRRAETGVPAKSATSLPETREYEALRLVYRTMGRTHRRYKERTGHRTPTALREAARAFRREPSVFSLVPVAGHLDDLGLLKW